MGGQGASRENKKQKEKDKTMGSNNSTKDEMKALYTAFDIHRRAATLAAMWIAFDPFGAVVYELRGLEDAAWNLREGVQMRKISWDFTKAPYRELLPIKKGKDNYGTFQNHIKGIEGAIRRIEANNWIMMMGHTTNFVRLAVETLREHIRHLRREM